MSHTIVNASLSRELQRLLDTAQQSQFSQTVRCFYPAFGPNTGGVLGRAPQCHRLLLLSVQVPQAIRVIRHLTKCFKVLRCYGLFGSPSCLPLC